ncbi:Casein kinase II subunit beta [Dictyocoela muelleri]|nr:Casein kinase II subunit beta [Dictyocoela muelleri]
MLTSTSDSSPSYDENGTWKEQFLSKQENKGLLNIPDSYINDKFNIVGINKYVENIEKCYEVILDISSSRKPLDESSLYLMIHQRYILTPAGLERMYNRVIKSIYGQCKRLGCEEIPYIPMGLSNIPRVSSVKLFCYNCKNVYDPENLFADLDGCAFGNTFPHLLYTTYKQNLKKNPKKEYVPRIFGFQIYNSKDKKERIDE